MCPATEEESNAACPDRNVFTCITRFESNLFRHGHYNMVWQKTFSLSGRGKGCHLITDEVVTNIHEGLKNVEAGMLFLFVKHTSCALTVNENYDRDVRRDMDMALDRIVPEDFPWLHTDEGPDDSVSHTKASLVGSSISLPITDGQLNLGTWQGIYLSEFRHLPHVRTVVATIVS